MDNLVDDVCLAMSDFNYMTMAYAGINFIHPPLDKPWARLEGSKNPSPGTIIVHKNPHLGTKRSQKPHP